MSEINEFVKRAADRTGFERISYIERNIPTTSDKVVIVPFFGDLKSTFILSSFLLKRYKESHLSKYIILCSWPGFQGLFPYVDEYWQPKDRSTLTTLASGAIDFGNLADISATYTRNLVNYFEAVFPEDWKPYYKNGFQEKFWESYKNIKLYMPEIPSTNRLTEDFKHEMTRRTGQKILIFPSRKVRSWQRGKTEFLNVGREFWVALVERLLKEDLVPVVYQNYWTHDVSKDFAEKCIYLTSERITDVLAAMRYVGCVLDIHSGISRMAIDARCPFICLDERMRYIEEKEYEIDDLCCTKIPRQYIFSFSTLMMTGTAEDWKNSMFDNIIIRIKNFMPILDRNNFESPNETYTELSYEKVRQRKIKRLGANFIRKY